jgi:integrase
MGGHADVIPIAPALAAHLAAAIKASSSDLVFPASDGSMLSEDANTERVLRSALARAGLVTGYDHTCRRCKAKGTPHVERHADATLRHCPRCHMKLWPRPLKSKMRFHDFRHTAATIMLRAGVDPHRYSASCGTPRSRRPLIYTPTSRSRTCAMR